MDVYTYFGELLDLVLNPQGEVHSGLQTHQPAAWRLSGKHPKQQEFQRQLRTLSALLENYLMRDLYHAKWKNFCSWCREHQLDPLHPFPQQVVDYLEQHYPDVHFSP